MESRHFTYDGPRKKAFITNPELKKECSILLKSNIFDVTTDSLDGSAVKVRLQPMQRQLACGQPILLSAFTLGQLPVLLTDRYFYSFEEVQQEQVEAKKFELHVAKQYWFWDMFVFKKNFKGKAGKALSAQYYQEQSIVSRPADINSQ